MQPTLRRLPRRSFHLCLALIAGLVLGLAGAAPAAAQPGYGGNYDYGSDNQLRVRAGLFTPDADSDYWDEKFDVFTGDEDDFADGAIGVDFIWGVGPGGLLLSGDFYDSEDEQAYLDFVDGSGFDIFHSTNLTVNAVTAGYVLQFGSSRVKPYVGAGGGLYLWELEEEGDFIDFFPADPEIFNARFEDEGETFGWFWLAGIEFGLGPQWGAFVEARGHNAEDELSGDFEGLGDLDLSGLGVTGGVSYSF